MSTNSVNNSSGYPDSWVSPGEAFEEIAMESFNQQLQKGIPPGKIEAIKKYAIASILENPENIKENKIPKLWQLCCKKMFQPLPAGFTKGHFQREKLNLLPEKVPPIPKDFYQMMQNPCPIFPNLKMYETHDLYLLCEEDKNIIHFLDHVSENKNNEYPNNPRENELGDREDAWSYVKKDYGNQPFETTYWALYLNRIVPNSGGLSRWRQNNMVEKLGKKTNIPYEVSAIDDIIRVLFLKVATGESFFSDPSTYTRIKNQKKGEEYSMVIGGSGLNGADIRWLYDSTNFIGYIKFDPVQKVGIIARIKL